MISDSLINELRKISKTIQWQAISNVEWRTQDSNSQSVLFYKFTNNSSIEYSKAIERLKIAKFSVCITNSTKILELENTINLSDTDFIKLQENFLNDLYPLHPNTIYLGVTGTNGKTTTVDLIRQICLLNNKSILTVGTLGVYKNTEVVENFSLTSPAYIDLRKTFHKYGKEVNFIVMELSSHALVQNRVGSIKFDGIGWTNFTQDHLDFHKTMDNYLEAKKIVFKKIKNNKKIAIPNSQVKLLDQIGRSEKIIKTQLISPSGNPFFRVNYNQENLGLAVELLNEYISIDHARLSEIIAPSGRLNIIPFKNNYIIIDFAHTPDAIESVCKEIKKDFEGYNLTTVFGCGGDRDRLKRSKMATSATKYSDFVILTSDNPRYEDPQQILEDASKGLGKRSVIIEDRKEAIAEGFKNLKKSILLIAGKGHEKYIDIKGVKHPYSDEDIIMELINA